jgi:hypothetical protein
MLAWHWIRKDRTLGYNDKRKVIDGRWLVHRGELQMCASGLHASKRIIDAFDYAPGPIICRVEIGGKIIVGNDKFVAERRKVLWSLNTKDILWEFARRCALDVIHLWDAPPIVIRYLKTGNESLRNAAKNATRDATWNAAWNAAKNATWDAAWNAAKNAAWNVAWNAAKNATWNAAKNATWDATWNAANTAARNTANAVAWDAATTITRYLRTTAWKAARDKQNNRLTQMIVKAQR